MRALPALALAVAFLVPGLPTVPATSVEGGGYTATNCVYFYGPLLGEAAAVRAEVPVGFILVGEVAPGIGQAPLFVTMATCDVSVDGRPPVRAGWSDVGALIVPPGGVPSLSLYWLWHVTNNSAMQDLMARHGVDAGFTRQSDVVTFETLATVPGIPLLQRYFGGYFVWPGNHYQLTAPTFTSTHHSGLDGAVSWWHQGAQGLVRMDQVFMGDQEENGMAALRADTGGRMGRLLAPETPVVGGETLPGSLNFADLAGQFI